ncbi:MAG TPA: hypothetical protein VK479_16890, partial [Micropepsaceae bacterium]|nr:hypothetical protein [Micropepsaceae bacterium]
FAAHPHFDAPPRSRFSVSLVAAMCSTMTLMRQSAAAPKHGAGQSRGLMQGLVESSPARLLAKPFVSLDLPPGVFVRHYLAGFRFSFEMFNNCQHFPTRIFELPDSFTVFAGHFS